MTTPELISYIKKQIQNNVSKDLIISNLVDVGWRLEDVNEAFLGIDMYHEPIEGNNLFEIKKEIPKIEVSKIEINKVETPKTQTPKIWTPLSVPIKEPKQIRNVGLDIKKPTTGVEVQELELTGHKMEPVPNPVSRPIVNSFEFSNKNISNEVKTNSPITVNEPPKNISQVAMLSSYKSDVLAVSKKKEEVIKKKNKKGIKWIIIIAIIVLIGGFAGAVMGGYIKIKNINLLNVKEDPKSLLLSNSKVLSSLKSYKTETNIEISSPSFSNISMGLISGEAISSPDKDSISINTLGIKNQNEQGALSDNFITIKGSLLPDYITTDIKSNGTDLFIDVPDLSKIMDNFTNVPSLVKVNEQQFDLLPPLFSEKIEAILKKVNIYKILSNGMSSDINTETLLAYDELINNVEITEKGVEEIKGINTYHYSINVDRQLSKKLLAKISDNFASNLSDGDKENLTQIIGAATVNSFDVWIGKGDNNIYQYNVILDIPLSKIIGFEDKSIGDNKVSINWKTTYYDFDTPNNLFMPDKFISITEFINTFKKAQLKNEVSSFGELATDLFGIEKSYGSKSNTSGSCMSPLSGSLFSPTGHTKNLTIAISSISILLNKVMGITNGAGFCYSTGKEWSFTIPIADAYSTDSLPEGGYTEFFCVDSTGAKETLTAFPKGGTCLPKVDSSLPKTTTITTPTAAAKQ